MSLSDDKIREARGRAELAEHALNFVDLDPGARELIEHLIAALYSLAGDAKDVHEAIDNL